MNTRIIVASLALAAGGLGLTACSSNTPAPFPAPAPVTVHDTPTQAPVTQAPVTTTDAPQADNSSATDDQAFLSVLRQRAVFLDGSDSGQISLGHSACTAMEAGVSLTDLVSLGAQDNISAYDMGWLLGAAQSAYCPSVTIPGT